MVLRVWVSVAGSELRLKSDCDEAVHTQTFTWATDVNSIFPAQRRKISQQLPNGPKTTFR